MELTEKYIAENVDCVFRNFNQIDGDRQSDRVKDRIKIITDFIKGAKKILSVGCGAHEPIDINATHAIDIAENSEGYLRNQGWKGEFKLASCDNIPFDDKTFDAAVCSEVIEHLPDLVTAQKTFQEINRVAQRWITTCPDWLGSEPTHKRAFNIDTLKQVTKGIDCKIEHRGRYWYVFHPRN